VSGVDVKQTAGDPSILQHVLRSRFERQRLRLGQVEPSGLILFPIVDGDRYDAAGTWLPHIARPLQHGDRAYGRALFLGIFDMARILREGRHGQQNQHCDTARGPRHHGIISLHRISFRGRTLFMEVNDKVADFTLQTEEDKTVHLKDYSGKPVVLFFYPRADTPGCTIEACGFRDVFKKIQQAGAVVLGISRDTPKAQKKFKEKYNLPYTLLADVDEVVCKQFDVLKQKNMYGKKVIGVERTTFLIGPDQKLLKIFPKVKPEGHAEEVLAAVKAARG